MKSQVKNFFERYERHTGIALMALGFFIDNLTLKRIDLLFDNLIFFFYLTIALSTILITNAYQGGKLRTRFMEKHQVWLSLPMQYAFGGLFSGFVVIYSRSGTVVASWLFLAILAALLIGNEFAKSNYARLTYRITIFFTAFFSYTIFYIPVLTKRMGAGTFLLSGAVSLLGIGIVLLVLRNLTRAYFRQQRVKVAASIASVFLLFNLLYFTNVIPPVPLSLKAIGIYHEIRTVSRGYTASVEPPRWYEFYNDTGRVFQRYGNEPVFVFSSIFAPTDLRTPVFHQWFFYDPQSRSWVAKDRLSFPILGGRDGGYRGYSQKRNVQEGKWRVDVVTARGQLIGRITFTVTAVDTSAQTNPVTL